MKDKSINGKAIDAYLLDTIHQLPQEQHESSAIAQIHDGLKYGKNAHRNNKNDDDLAFDKRRGYMSPKRTEIV